MCRGKSAYTALCIRAGTLIQVYPLNGHVVSMSFLLEISVELHALLPFPDAYLQLFLEEENKYLDNCNKIPVFYLVTQKLLITTPARKHGIPRTQTHSSGH